MRLFQQMRQWVNAMGMGTAQLLIRRFLVMGGPLFVFFDPSFSATPSPLPSTRLPEISFTSTCTLFWLGVLAVRASSSILKGVEFDYEAPGSSFLTVLAYSILILITTLSNDAIPDSRVKAPVTTPLCYDVLAFGLPLSSSTVTISNGPPNT
ncbi:hypothetical protein D9758_017821 [Tetrapyrgos nigripes]|uniref:Uncharacterized protein n=1 Tax=Tetrapyrgos nigripes TaxID=182062 RepID=A0A8H5C662_9AGAR|nr:hypothetical protein D9758_017821 [Tetrapyrgos nigripes]